MTTSTLDQNQEDLNQQEKEIDRLKTLLANKKKVLENMKTSKKLLQKDLNNAVNRNQQQTNYILQLTAFLAEKERVIDSLKATKCLERDLNDIRGSTTTYEYKLDGTRSNTPSSISIKCWWLIPFGVLLLYKLINKINGLTALLDEKERIIYSLKVTKEHLQRELNNVGELNNISSPRSSPCTFWLLIPFGVLLLYKFKRYFND